MTDLLRIVQRELSPPSKISLLILKDNFHPASVHDSQDSVGCGRGGGIMGETRERGKFFLGGDGQASHAHHPTRRDLPADHGTAVAVVTDYGEVARG